MGQTPPPYYGAAPKKTNTTTVVLIVLGVCAVCCVLAVVGLGGAAWFGFSKVKGMAACAMGFEEAREAMRAYAQDHKGMLPPAKSWQDDIQPYFARVAEKNADGRKFIGAWEPSGEWACVNDNAPKTGIAFNSELAGKKVNDIKNKGTTILLFETEQPGKNVSMPFEEKSDENSPKMMNKPRGWIKVPVEGETHMKGQTVNFGTTSD